MNLNAVPIVEEVKAQPIRLLDVFVFGPLMIYMGTAANPGSLARTAIIAVGVGSILYNLRNYRLIEKYQ